jgi:hypothetical protein
MEITISNLCFGLARKKLIILRKSQNKKKEKKKGLNNGQEGYIDLL